jgi:predicted Zn-dependent protease
LAEQAYGQAPESAGVLDTYGVVLLENGQARRALRLLERAHKATGRAPVTGYHLARALARTDDKARARRVLEETLANNEDFPEAKKARALLDRLNGG